MLTDTLPQILAEGPHFGGGPGPFLLLPLLFWLLVIGGIVTGIVMRGRRFRSAPRRDAEAQLSARFAAGEIEEEEFRARRAVLREKG